MGNAKEKAFNRRPPILQFFDGLTVKKASSQAFELEKIGW